MSRQARQRRRRHNRSGPTRFLLIGGGVLRTLIVGAIAAVGYVLNVAQSAPTLDTLHAVLSGGSSQVFAADGTRLGFIQSDELRSPVGWSEIPADLKNATVAIEDQRFYKNDGVDLTGIFRAAVKDITHGEALQGGSTITMQLMRNLYLGGDQRTLRQKIIEAKLAIEYNKAPQQALDPHELSEQRPLRHGRRSDSDRRAGGRADLLRQAGVPSWTSRSPRCSPACRRRRRNTTRSTTPPPPGSGATRCSRRWPSCTTSPPRRRRRAEAAPLEVRYGDYYSQRREDFFFEYVREQLVDRYGANTVAQGGLKVYTTINLNLQRLARKAIAEVLDEHEDPAAAIVTDQPAQRRHRGDGGVRELREVAVQPRRRRTPPAGLDVQGDRPRRRALARRRPEHAPTTSRTRSPLAGCPATRPTKSRRSRASRSTCRSTSSRRRLQSDNTVYAQLAADLGEQTVTQMAYKMGVTTHLSSFPAEALGGLTLGVTPAGNGRRLRHPRGRRLAQHPDRDHEGRLPRRSRRLQLGHAAPREGAERRRDRGGDEHPRSRTSRAAPRRARRSAARRPPRRARRANSSTPGWTATRRNYSTVVWMGYPNKRVSMTDVHGEPQQGGYLPAEIWHDYMSAVTEGKPCVPFPPTKESISYKPFFGKFATTGRAKPSRPKHRRNRGPSETSPQPATSTSRRPAKPLATERRPPAARS